MATRIITARLTKKGSVKLKYKQQEVGKGGLDDLFDAEYSKTSSQVAHRDLTHALDALVPHLLFSSELIDNSVAIPTNIKDEDYFTKWHWEDDQRFSGFSITGIKTFGKQAIEGVYLYGQKETKNGDIIEIKSPLISLDRSPDNIYPLHVIFGAQFETLVTELDKYAFEGKNVNTITNQMALFDK